MMKLLLMVLIAGTLFLGTAVAIPVSTAIFHTADSTHAMTIQGQKVVAGYNTQTFAFGNGKLNSESTITSSTQVNGNPESIRLDSQVTSNTNGATRFGANTAITRTSYGPDLVKSSQIRFYSSMVLPFAVGATQIISGQLTSAGGAGAIENTLSVGKRDYTLNAEIESAIKGISSQSLSDGAILPFNGGLDWTFGVGYLDNIRTASGSEYMGGIDFTREVSM